MLKNIVLVGRPQADEEKFLALMQSQTLLRGNFIYQLKKIPGAGIRMRPLNPYVRETTTTSEILDAADAILMLQDSNDDFQNIVEGHEFTTLDEYAPVIESKNANKIYFPYSEHYLYDALKLVSLLHLYGYNFKLVTNDADFNRLIPLTVCYDLPNIDFTLRLVSRVPQTTR